MTGTGYKQYNLPWHQNSQYWISLYPRQAAFARGVQDKCSALGFTGQPDGSLAVQTTQNWRAVWEKLYAALLTIDALSTIDAAITPGSECPPSRNTSAPAAHLLASSMWIGDALLQDRIMCYLQPVQSAQDKIFGYESFARAKDAHGSIIGGEEIVAASQVLGIEHMIDRHLHVEAIRTFASSAFNGFLFVNFFPGFIHRPSVYLEGLSETAKQYGVIAKHIVLDFTKSDTPRDMQHIKSVADYSRSCGYSIALDDITSLDTARKLVQEVRPDFMKIDMQLVRQVTDSGKRETVRTLAAMAHDAGGTVIAEGVETQEIYDILKSLGVDLFQGYFFSPPVPVEAALPRSASSAS